MQIDDENEELAVELRRLRLKGTRLAVPTDPILGEGFRDVLFRAAVDNGHQSLATLTRMIGLKGSNVLSRYGVVAAKVDISTVADILGTPVGQSDVEPLLYKNAGPGSVNLIFFGRSIRRSSLFGPERRVSPLALKASLHQRAVWGLRAFSFDPGTMQTLITHCPSCGDPLNFKSTWGIEKCHNAYDLKGNDGECVDVDFRECVTPLDEVEDMEALRFVCHLVDPLVSPSDAARSIPAPFIEFGPGQVFEVIFTLARMYVALVNRHTGQELNATGYRLRQVTAAELAKAARAILGWPVAYHEFSEALRIAHLERQKDAKNGHWHPLKKLDPRFDDKLRSLFVLEAAKAMQTTFDENASLSIVNGAEISRRDVMDVRTICEIGGSKEGRTNIVNRNILERISLGHDDLFAVRKMSRAESLVDAMRTAPALRSFSLTCGIAVPFISALYDVNLLEILDLRLERYFTRSEEAPTEKLIHRILSLVRKGPAPNHAVPLSAACAALTVRRVNPWPSILRAICDNKLRVWNSARVTPTLAGRLYVADYDQLRSALEGLDEVGSLSSVRISSKEAAMAIGVSDAFVSRLFKAEVIPRTPKLEHLWSFHEQFILTKEVVCRGQLLGTYRFPSFYSSQLDDAGIHSIPLPYGVTARDRHLVEEYYGELIADRV